MRITLLTLALLTQLIAGEAVQTSWIRNASGTGSARPDVHTVTVTDAEVIVRSAGLSLRYFGPLQMPPIPEPTLREFEFRVPRRPQPADGTHARVPVSIVGVFLNGLPIYNQFETLSFQNEDVWHYDAIRANGPAPGGLLEDLILSGKKHSPLIGFALDGNPIYGPWGLVDDELQRMRPSYRLRTQMPIGRPLAPSGTFCQDYEYVEGLGHLDRFNGRWAVTPEYPNGTYAYFLATKPDGTLAYPYLLADRFYGKYPEAPKRAPGVTLSTDYPRLTLHVTGADGEPVRHLPVIHERAIHLIVVSRNLNEFSHIHPVRMPNDDWEVTHEFEHSGPYTLYAEFANSVQRFEVSVPAGNALRKQASPLNVQLTHPPLVTGRDIPLRFALPVTDLEPYLGAWAHIVLIGEKERNFIHAHPEGEPPAGLPHSHISNPGPSPASIVSTVNFSTPGRYRMWAQFQRHGEELVIPYQLDVLPGPSPTTSSNLRPPGAIPIRIDATGFHPASIEGAAGARITLAFIRSAEPNCGGKIVFPETGVSRTISPGETALISIEMPLSGELYFTCGMGMLRGSLVAR